MAMFAAEKPDPRQGEIYEDVSREDIVSAFRTAMIGHFRSHYPRHQHQRIDVARKRLSQSLP
jgi:hypothetical protein